MVSAPSKSDKPNEWEYENGAEEAAGEEEGEDDETGELARVKKEPGLCRGLPTVGTQVLASLTNHS